jgi:carbamoyl-phosphate synthase large subunit
MIGGIMEHIEQAGVHSGDSACSLPPYTCSPATAGRVAARPWPWPALNVVGLMNVQFAIQGEGRQDVIYVLEVNPRASRTVPFVSKATGQPLAKVAARCMAGQPGRTGPDRRAAQVTPPYFSVKEAVFPFNKFPGVDPILGPEMKSTGEVMGVGKTFGEAMLKSQLGAGSRLPTEGTVVHHGQERRQGARREGGAALVSAWASRGGHQGHGGGDRAAGVPVNRGQQGQGRPPAHRRHDQGGRDPAGLQHRGRASHRDRRLAPDPHRGCWPTVSPTTRPWPVRGGR